MSRRVRGPRTGLRYLQFKGLWSAKSLQRRASRLRIRSEWSSFTAKNATARKPGSCRTGSLPSRPAGATCSPSRRWSCARRPAVVSVARRIVGNAEDARDVAQMAFLRVWEQLVPVRRDLLLQHLALPDRDEPRDRFPEELPQPREGTHRDAPPRAPARRADRAPRRRAPPRTIRRRASSTGIAGRLTGKQKAAFVLREMEDLDTSEIAAILGCGESTVRNHLFNARRILRREIERVAPGLGGRSGEEAMTLSCGEVRDRFEAYGAEALAAEERRAVRDHLGACETCRAEASASDPLFLLRAAGAAPVLPRRDGRGPRGGAHGHRVQDGGAAPGEARARRRRRGALLRGRRRWP